MANLILPHRFVPGQLALASEMNANFEAIETWAGGNLGTTNITVLEARPGGGSILEFNQTANFPVLDVTNSGADTAIDITQAGLLQTGKAVIDITDSNPQAAANTAHFRMTLSSSTNIPAIEVKHGIQNTLTVSKNGITTDTDLTVEGKLTVNGETELNDFVAVNAETTFADVVNVESDVISDKYYLSPKFLDVGNKSGSYTADLSLATVIKMSLTSAGALSLTLTNPTIGGVYVFEIYHAIAASTVTWPASVKWQAGTPPQLSQQALKTDVVSLIYTGTNYYGNAAVGY